MRKFAFRLIEGKDLKEEIISFVKFTGIKAGIILTCVGSLSKLNVRLAGAENIKTLDGFFEIVSLVGTLSQDGVHIHISVSDHNGNNLGGHLQNGCIVRTTAEVVIEELEEFEFKRDFDKHTGFKELTITKR